jgi:hypothetical protein
MILTFTKWHGIKIETISKKYKQAKSEYSKIEHTIYRNLYIEDVSPVCCYKHFIFVIVTEGSVKKNNCIISF